MKSRFVSIWYISILAGSMLVMSCEKPKDEGSNNGPPEENLVIDPPIVFTPVSFTDTVETWDQSFDACSESNNGNTFWRWELQGREPQEPGKFPLYIHLVGTGDVATNPYAIEMIQRMSAKGFVAASVPYDSFGGIGAVIFDPTAACAGLAKKTECIFGARPRSAVSLLCARAKADCSKGIVVSGHSQGSGIAVLAKNHDTRVRAVYAMGAGIHMDLFGIAKADLSGCALPSNRTLPADRIRVVDGESEYIYGANLTADVKALTGKDCGADLECLNANGSGYTYFPNSASETDTSDSAGGALVARHCYFANTPPGDCGGTFTGLNSNWSAGTSSYSLNPSLDWLSGFADR